MVFSIPGTHKSLCTTPAIGIVFTYPRNRVEYITGPQITDIRAIFSGKGNIIIFIVIATAYIIQCLLGEEIPLREITILFFIANEGISLIENASEFVPIPEKLKDVLIQIRKESDE